MAGRGKATRRSRLAGADLFGRENVRGIGGRIFTDAVIEFVISREKSGKRLPLDFDDSRILIRSGADLRDAERLGQPTGTGEEAFGPPDPACPLVKK